MKLLKESQGEFIEKSLEQLQKETLRLSLMLFLEKSMEEFFSVCLERFLERF